MGTAITLLVVVALGAMAAGLVFNKQFRTKVFQVLRIKSNQALDGATTAVEKQQDTYEQLLAKLPGQRASVTSVMATASQAKNDLERARGEVSDLEAQYARAKELGASEAALDELGDRYTDAVNAVTAQETVLAAANAAATEAREALEATTKAIARFGKQVESDRNKAELAAALRVTAEARQATQDINSTLSQAGQAHRQVEHELEQARAANELSKGSATDVELANLEAKARAQAGRSALESKLGGGTTPPAV